MKKKICFIVNPISGVGKQKVIEGLASDYLDMEKYDYKIIYTNAPKHAILLAKQAAEELYDIVVAVGGDGSVNEVANGLIGTNTAMALLPTGSGNGLARHLKIPLDLKQALTIINTGKQSQIDTIQFNDTHFVNVAGIGFDAQIGWEFANYGKRGFSSYIKLVLRELRQYQSEKYELIFDGESVFKEAFLISFANGSQWGNNAYIAPMADISDGLMDIAILKKINWRNGLSVGYHLFNRKLHQTKHLEIIKAKEVTVKQKRTIAHIDGEPIESGAVVTVKVNPLSLKIIVP